MRPLSPLLVVLFALLLSVAVPEVNAQAYYTLPADSTAGPLPDKGQMVSLYNGAGEKLKVWVEHGTPARRPNYDRADEADLVVWCYPEIWTHDNHVLPDATGEILSISHPGESREVVFTEAESRLAEALEQQFGP